MFKRVLSIALAFIGLIVGAGFASGQEMMQFFVAFGIAGVIGAVVASVLMIVSGMAALVLGSYMQAKDHTAVFDGIAGSLLSRLLDLTTMVTLFAIGFVMFAGGGANMAQQFDWPVWAGSLLILVAVLVAGMFDVKRVTNLIAVLTPFMMVFLIAASVWTLVQADIDMVALNLAAREVQTTLPSWWVGALNYVGFSVVTAVSMSIVIGGDVLDTRRAGLGGALGGLFFTVLLVLAVGALFVEVDAIHQDDMPMLSLVNRIHPWVGVAMSVAILTMIFSTALGMFYALGKRLSRGNPARFRVVYVGSLLVGFALSFVGFRDLVSYIYPALGYMGLAVIVTLGLGWLRGHSIITTETGRRKRLRRLALRRLDPRQDFTARHAAELRRLSRDSNVDEAELHATLVERAESELEDDPDLDYTPLAEGTDPTEVLTGTGPARKTRDGGER